MIKHKHDENNLNYNQNLDI